jgi:hypothetical protein
MQLNDTTTLIGLKQDLYFIGKFNATTFNQLDLNRIINKYYKQVQEDLRGVNEDFFMVSTKADLPLYSVNNGSFSLPLDCEKVKSIWVAVQPASSAAPLTTEYIRCNIIDANAITTPSYVFSVPTVVMFGAYFVLYPQLTNTAIYPVTGGMKMYYIPQQTDLVNDSDVPNVFSDYHDVITWGALVDIAPRIADEKLLAQATKQYKQRRDEMKRDASQRFLDVSQSYVEGQSPEGGWMFPFGNNNGI